MRPGRQLCWCQGGGARQTAHVQCVIHLTGGLSLCTGHLHQKQPAAAHCHNTERNLEAATAGLLYLIN